MSGVARARPAIAGTGLRRVHEKRGATAMTVLTTKAPLARWLGARPLVPGRAAVERALRDHPGAIIVVAPATGRVFVWPRR